MAVKLIANYAKRLGLPGYSSHNFSVSVETEMRDLGDVQGEATRLYGLLQDAVDREIQHTGFVPPGDYGFEEPINHPPGNGSPTNSSNGHAGSNGGRWKCSEKQQEFLLNIIDERNLDRDELEEFALDQFGHGLSQMDKAEASGLLDSLMANGSSRGRSRRTKPGHRPYVADGRRGQ